MLRLTWDPATGPNGSQRGSDIKQADRQVPGSQHDRKSSQSTGHPNLRLTTHPRFPGRPAFNFRAFEQLRANGSTGATSPGSNTDTSGSHFEGRASRGSPSETNRFSKKRSSCTASINPDPLWDVSGQWHSGARHAKLRRAYYPRFRCERRGEDARYAVSTAL